MSKDLQIARVALVATHQQVALLLCAGATVLQLPLALMAAVSPVTYATPPPTYMPPPPTAYAPPSYPPISVTIYQQPYGQL